MLGMIAPLLLTGYSAISDLAPFGALGNVLPENPALLGVRSFPVDDSAIETPYESPEDRDGLNDDKSIAEEDYDSAESVDLQKICPDPELGLTKACKSALDALYLDETPFAQTLIPVPDQPTWREVLDSPSDLFQRVVDAMGNEECRDRSIRIASWLYESCRAHDFAALAILNGICANPERYTHPNGWVRPVESFTQYIDHMTKESMFGPHMRNDPYRLAWIANKCLDIPEHVFDPIYRGIEMREMMPDRHYHRSHIFVVYSGLTWSYRDIVQPNSRSHNYVKYRVRAATFGNRWAMARYDTRYPLINALYRFDPPLALLHLGTRSVDSVYSRSVHFSGLVRALVDELVALDATGPQNLGTVVVTYHGVHLGFSRHQEMQTRPELAEVHERYIARFEKRHAEIVESLRSVEHTYLIAAQMMLHRDGRNFNEAALPDWLSSSSEEATEAATSRARTLVEKLDSQNYPLIRNRNDFKTPYRKYLPKSGP